jgi:3-(3-hydroxy-phenyl)propionate hydroxylase
MTLPDLPVGIVGGGPVGLTLALRLAGLGVSSVVLEAEPRLRRQGSKACLVQGDVLEVLDKVGCAEQIATEGVTWRVARTYVRGREIRRTVYPTPLGFGPFVNISQYRVEQVLLERLLADPHCQLRWSHRVTALDQDADGVTAAVQTPAGPASMRFRYLVACDGVHSQLRELAGARWTGYSHGDQFLITDIRAPLRLAQERHFHYDPPFNPGRQLVIHPQPDSVWRIDWQLAPGTDIEAERRTGALDRRIRAVIGEVPYQVEWLSTYRFHQRVVDQFVLGRVFLAGDAAHALPPYGARGMNSGIQDADNLAWKLALVLAERADPALLATYHDERHAAAEENLRVTEATIRFMVPPTPLRRWARNSLLRLATPLRPLRRHVNSGQMAEPFVYPASGIIAAQDGAGPAAAALVGRFAPDAPVLHSGRPARLRRLFGSRFVGLLVGAEPAAALRFARAAGLPGGTVPAGLAVALPAAAAAGAASTSAASTSTVATGTELAGLADVVGEDGPGLRSTYQQPEPTWYLVRPDGHIAAVGPAADPAVAGPALAAALARCAAARAPQRSAS